MEDPYGPVPVAVEAGRVEPHKSAVAEIQAVVAYEEPPRGFPPSQGAW